MRRCNVWLLGTAIVADNEETTAHDVDSDDPARRGGRGLAESLPGRPEPLSAGVLHRGPGGGRSCDRHRGQRRRLAQPDPPSDGTCLLDVRPVAVRGAAADAAAARDDRDAGVSAEPLLLLN